MSFLKDFKGLNNSTGLTGIGGLFGITSANQAAAGGEYGKTPASSSFVRNVLVTLLSFIIMGFFAAITVNIKWINPLTEAVSNFSFSDIYYSILHDTGKPERSNAVTMVDIYQFQGRGKFATLIEEIEAQHPSVICIDAVFEGTRMDDQDGDMALAQVIDKYDNIVISMKLEEVHLQGDDWNAHKAIHSYFTEFVKTREAFCNMQRGNLYDAMKREISIKAYVDTMMYHSLIAETVNLYAGYDVTEGRRDNLKINYSPTDFPTIIPSEVKNNIELIQDRIVILGDLHDQIDQHWSPVGEKLPGAVILAYGIQTMLDKTEIVLPNWIIMALLSFAVVLIMLYIINTHSKITQNSTNLFVRFFLGSAYARGMIIFFYSALLLMISFVIFVKWHISINWGWALSGIAFLSTADNLFNAIQGYNVQRRMSRKVKKGIDVT